jgi:dTMP kinase
MFITIEGIEGSGKTTQLPHLVAFLENRGHDCVVTREPGGTGIGEKIRAILLDPTSSNMDPRAELLLYVADRIQHVNELIKPSLECGRTVVCDRYIDSTVVYQGYARQLDIEVITGLHRLMREELKPDITILLDLPAEMGLKRAWDRIDRGTRIERETRFEEEDIIFHERVRRGFLELSRGDPGRFRIIDASMDEERVRMAIISVLS